MSDSRPAFIDMGYGLLTALICLVAIAALDAQLFLLAGLCIMGSVVCSHRVGQAVALRLDLGRGRAGRHGPRNRVS